MDVFKAFAQQVGIVDPFGPGFLSVIITFLVALVFTWFFMPRLREFAVQAGWADMPNARRLNKEPLPNAGGLGIFVGFVVSMVLLATAAQFPDRAAAVILLALARISGETAPLLFTALGNDFFTLDIFHPMSGVPQVMYKFAGSGFENWEKIAWAGALVITLFVLAVSLFARTILLRNRITHD